MSDTTNTGEVSSERLRAFVLRIEKLEEDKASVLEDIKDVYSEVKSTGFDAKTVRRIIKERKLTSEERAEQDCLFDLYKAALGMLDGTPLGAAAIDRLKKEKNSSSPKSQEENGQQEKAPSEKPISDKEIEKARKAGIKSGEKGSSVTDNPFPAHDTRRAAWDEGWCQSTCSDGMDIPDAWRRKKKTQDGEDKS